MLVVLARVLAFFLVEVCLPCMAIAGKTWPRRHRRRPSQPCSWTTPPPLLPLHFPLKAIPRL